MIRPYQPQDKNRLLQLLQLNTPRYFASEEATDFVEYLNHKKEDYFVFEKEDQLVGCAGVNYFPEEKTARLSWDMIHPDMHGKGIGKQLTLHRIAHIRQQKLYSSIVVRTSQLAYLFYQKFGFEVENIEKDYWAEGFDLYVMRLHLSKI